VERHASCLRSPPGSAVRPAESHSESLSDAAGPRAEGIAPGSAGTDDDLEVALLAQVPPQRLRHRRRVQRAIALRQVRDLGDRAAARAETGEDLEPEGGVGELLLEDRRELRGRGLDLGGFTRLAVACASSGAPVKNAATRPRPSKAPDGLAKQRTPPGTAPSSRASASRDARSRRFESA